LTARRARGFTAWPALGVVCVAATAAIAMASEAEAEDCLLEPAVYRYLARVQDRILEHWKLPPDGMANREVVVRLVFDAAGGLSKSDVVSWTDRRLARSAMVAVAQAAPFGPVEAQAACLVGLPIRTTLRNPAE
jgi:hypothetical protein